MPTVEEALLLIPGRRDILVEIDDKLSRAIVHVESVLKQLQVNIPVAIQYTTADGSCSLEFRKHDSKWQIIWGNIVNKMKFTPLLMAPRHVRADVFTLRDGEFQSPIEQLLVEAAASLEARTKDRSPQLERALYLVGVLEKAGFAVDTAPKVP